MNLQSYDNLIFDLGQVLVSLNREETIQAFQNLGMPDARSLIGQSAQGGVFGQLEIGEITEPEFYDKVRLICSNPTLSNEEISNAWNTMIGETPKHLLQMMISLKSTKRLYLLSNANPIHIRYMQQRHFKTIPGYDITNYFDRQFLSYEMHLKKPDEKIFKKMIEIAKFDLEKTIFFDDNAENVRVAQECGLNAMQVSSPQEMASILSQLF